MAPQETPFRPESVLAGSFGRKVIEEAQRMAARQTDLPGQGWQVGDTRDPAYLRASDIHGGASGPWKHVEINCKEGVMNAFPVGNGRPRLGVVPSQLSMQVRESGLVEVTAELIRGVHMRLVRALFDADGNLCTVNFGIAGGPYGLQRPLAGEEMGPTPFERGEDPRKRITMSESMSPPPSCRDSASKMSLSKRVIHDLGFGARAESSFVARVDDFGDEKDSLRVMCPDQCNDPAVTLVRSLPTHFAGGQEALRWLFVEEIDRVMRDIPPAPSAPSPEVPPVDAAAVAVAAAG